MKNIVARSILASALFENVRENHPISAPIQIHWILLHR